VLSFDELDEHCLLAPRRKVVICLGGNVEREERVPPAKIRLVAARCELLAGVGADRLEHPEALGRVPNQAFVDERLERVQARVRHAFGRLERAAAAEDGEASE
jgi:hypothetical protein